VAGNLRRKREDAVDNQQRQQIEAQLDKLGRDAQRIAENAKNALDHLRQGDVQAACDIVALSHYPIGHVKVDHDALMESFTAGGVEPGAGR
jgi:hypothetical protein